MLDLSHSFRFFFNTNCTGYLIFENEIKFDACSFRQDKNLGVGQDLWSLPCCKYHAQNDSPYYPWYSKLFKSFPISSVHRNYAVLTAFLLSVCKVKQYKEAHTGDQNNFDDSNTVIILVNTSTTLVCFNTIIGT